MTHRGIGTIALGLTLAATLACAGTATASTVLTTGTLTDANGHPAAGEVRLYAFPLTDRAMTLPLVGSATAGPDGAFTSTRSTTAGCCVSPSRATAGWTSPRSPTRPATRERGPSRCSSTRAAAPCAPSRPTPSPPPTASPALRRGRACWPRTSPSRRAGRSRRTRTRVSRARARTSARTAPGVTRELAVVGELNNAYNDGTWASSATAGTRRGHRVRDRGQVRRRVDITGTNTSPTRASCRSRRCARYSRRMNSLFEFTKHLARNNTCAVWDTYIKAVTWHGGDNDDVRVAQWPRSLRPQPHRDVERRREVQAQSQRGRPLRLRRRGVRGRPDHEVRLLAGRHDRVRVQGPDVEEALPLRVPTGASPRSQPGRSRPAGRGDPKGHSCRAPGRRRGRGARRGRRRRGREGRATAPARAARHRRRDRDGRAAAGRAAVQHRPAGGLQPRQHPGHDRARRARREVAGARAARDSPRRCPPRHAAHRVHVPLAGAGRLQRPARHARLHRPPHTSRKGRRGVELVFVLRADRPGAHQFSGARVDYRIGGRRYRTTLWEGARICAVAKLPERVEPDCDPVDLRGKTYG